MNSSVETILIYTILAGLLSIVYGFFTGKQILNASSGNDKMRDIASAIQIGAKAYLNRQYKTIAIVGVVVLIIISYAFSILVGLGYLIGAALSGIAGYVGMLVSVEANVRTAEASRKGLSNGLSVAFKSGAVTGMLVAGLALLAIAVYREDCLAEVYWINLRSIHCFILKSKSGLLWESESHFIDLILIANKLTNLHSVHCLKSKLG